MWEDWGITLQGLCRTGYLASLRPARKVEAHVAVHPMNTLVVPGVTIATKPMETLPEAPTGPLSNDIAEGRDYRRISLSPIHSWPIERRTRQARNFAGPGL
jgi:hypothetical protein